MPERSHAERIEILEKKVEPLELLPSRMTAIESRLGAVESQLLQLRAEMRAEFSAVRAELRGEIKDGDEETRRYMRVLHEEVIDRIKTIGEPRRRRKP